MRSRALPGAWIGALVAGVAAAPACGGRAGPPAPPAPPEEEIVRIPSIQKEPEPEPPPPPPEQWAARVELTPVKRAKMKKGAVKLWQTEGAPLSLMAAFDGLKPGRYHFVIHEGTECGKDARQVGAPWGPAAAVGLPIEVQRKGRDAIEMSGVALTLGGEEAIVGRTLVLHDDKRGTPHKAIACGVIAAEEPVEAEGDDPDDLAE
jgi:Cu/Zn superoxide dismutase